MLPELADHFVVELVMPISHTKLVKRHLYYSGIQVIFPTQGCWINANIDNSHHVATPNIFSSMDQLFSYKYAKRRL